MRVYPKGVFTVKKLKVTYNSPVILTFVVLCLIALALGFVTRGASTKVLFSTYHSSLLNPLTYIRFFTHILGHGSWAHFIGNASYLLLLGPMIEEKYGSKTTIEIILITALVTGLVNYIFFWNTALCGASGVVFSFILLASFTGFKDGEIPLTFILVSVIFIGQQIYEGITVSDHISNMAHIVGGLTGGGLGYILNKK